MVVFFFPLLIGLALSGGLIGFAVGRKAWGLVGGLFLAFALGLFPIIISLAGFLILLRTVDLPRLVGQ